MHKTKIILPIILIIILLVSIYLGLILSSHKPMPAQQHLLLNQHTMATNVVPQTVAADTHDHITAQSNAGANQPMIKIENTPYGKLVTTKQTGTKDGVQYQITNTRLLPKGAAIHHINQPRVVIRNTPYGKVIETQNANNPDNNQWQVIESTRQRTLTQQQLQTVEHHILEQQQRIEQMMQNQMQQMLQDFPVRFKQPGPHNPNH